MEKKQLKRFRKKIMREKESPALKQIVSFDGDTLFQIVCKLTFFSNSA